jgi:hypothetical protein
MAQWAMMRPQSPLRTIHYTSGPGSVLSSKAARPAYIECAPEHNSELSQQPRWCGVLESSQQVRGFARPWSPPRPQILRMLFSNFLSVTDLDLRITTFPSGEGLRCGHLVHSSKLLLRRYHSRAIRRRDLVAIVFASACYIMPHGSDDAPGGGHHRHPSTYF